MSFNEIKGVLGLLPSFLVLGSLVIIFMGPYICRRIKNIPIIKKQLRKYWEWKCKKYGHITYGRLTGLPQAHCRRCGEKTSNAADFCKDKIEPWGEYE